jgi:CheY-like chemotaxis protein
MIDGGEGILFVEDDPSTVSHLERTLDASGVEVVYAFDADQAIDAIRERDFGLLLVDVRLEGNADGGFDFLRRRAELISTGDVSASPYVVCSSFSSPESVRRVGADAYPGYLQYLSKSSADLTQLQEQIDRSDLSRPKERIVRDLVELHIRDSTFIDILAPAWRGTAGWMRVPYHYVGGLNAASSESFCRRLYAWADMNIASTTPWGLLPRNFEVLDEPEGPQ